MRLINVQRKELEEFFESEIPAYAILSHRWGHEELTFKEVLKENVDQNKKGYKKLLKACDIAADCGVNYLWIDTCCIDKRSSAELSEAINSMFLWYENSMVCLVLLEDVTINNHDLPRVDFQKRWHLREAMRQSVWFTRAWTLQELIAPRNVEFYDSTGTSIGSKVYMWKELQTITGIDRHVLTQSRPLQKCPVAEKMSWAVNRVSTRPEDIAYSLMGIFGVNMPLLYGEKRKAFMRLQEEIVRHTNDPTVLFWGLNGTANTLFASSPRDFRALHGVKVVPPLLDNFNLTNFGIDVEAVLMEWDQSTYGLHIGTAEHQDHAIDISTAPGEYILLLRQNRSRGVMYRAGLVNRSSWKPGNSSPWTGSRSFTLSRANREQELEEIRRSSTRCLGFRTPTSTVLPIKYVKTSDSHGSSQWNSFLPAGGEIVNCRLVSSKRDGAIRIAYTLFDRQQLHVDLGFDFNCNPCAFLHHQHDKRCIWDVHGLPPEATELSTRKGLGGQRMINMTDERTGHVGFFFRCANDEAVSVAIPEALISGQHSFWINLVPPRLGGGELWTFEMIEWSQNQSTNAASMRTWRRAL